MAVIKAVPTKATARLNRSIKYVTNPNKTEEVSLISGKDCNPKTAYEEMQATKELFGKTEGRQYKHFIQSFRPDDPLDHAKAHELGKEFAEKHFKGYEVLIATHKDKDHIHNHFIVNSVNFENGMKFHEGKAELKKMKELNDEICEREGLNVLTKEEQTPGKSLSMNEYQVAMKGESWKFKTMADIDQALDRTRSKEEFIKVMEDKGYQVKWTDTRKYITYTAPDGIHKIRDNKLHDPKYLKEAMENGFKRTQENQLQSGQSGRGSDIGTDIIFKRRDNRTDPISSKRNVEPGATDPQANGARREDQGRTGKETLRERDGQERAVSQSQQNSSSTTSRDKGSKSNELKEAGGDIRNSQRGSKKEPGKQYKNDSRDHGSSAPGKNHPKSKLEGKGEAIRNAAPNNSRTSNRPYRGIPTADPLDDVIKALGDSLEMVRERERAEAERMRQKLEQKMNNPRSKHHHQEEEQER